MKAGLSILHLAFVVTLIAAASGWDYGWDLIIGIIVCTFLVQEKYTYSLIMYETEQDGVDKKNLYCICKTDKRKVLKIFLIGLLLIPVVLIVGAILLTLPEWTASVAILLLIHNSSCAFADYMAFVRGISFLKNQVLIGDENKPELTD